MAAASATQMIAVWIFTDMTEGIVARFPTMAIARSSVLAGHVYGGVILVLFATAVLLGFAILLGYRPQAYQAPGSPSPDSSCFLASPLPGSPSPSASPPKDQKPRVTPPCSSWSCRY